VKFSPIGTLSGFGPLKTFGFYYKFLLLPDGSLLSCPYYYRKILYPPELRKSS
jgi:hypothetical protein